MRAYAYAYESAHRSFQKGGFGIFDLIDHESVAMLTEHNVLKRPVVLPPHGFSPAMVKAMSAVCSTVLPSLPFPSPEDPATAAAGLNPCFFRTVHSDFKPDSNDVRNKLFGKAYGKERRAALEQMYALDMANTTLPDDVRLPLFVHVKSPQRRTFCARKFPC